MTDIKPDTTAAFAACRDFIKSGGTLAQWRVIYFNAAAGLSEDELALSKLKEERDSELSRELKELAEKMERELPELTGQPIKK